MFYLMRYDNLTGKYSELSRRTWPKQIKEDCLDASISPYSHLEIWNEKEKNNKYHYKGE